MGDFGPEEGKAAPRGPACKRLVQLDLHIHAGGQTIDTARHLSLVVGLFTIQYDTPFGRIPTDRKTFAKIGVNDPLNGPHRSPLR